MGRPAKPYWHSRKQAWVSTCEQLQPIGSSHRIPIPLSRTPGKEGFAEAVVELQRRLLAGYRRERVIGESRGRTCQDVAQAFIDDLRGLVDRGERSAETLRSHKERLTVFINDSDKHRIPFGDRGADSITDDDLAWWIEVRRKAGDSPIRVKGLVSTLKACWAWAARPTPGREPKKLIETDRIAAVRIAGASSGSRKVPTRSEIAAVMLEGLRRYPCTTRGRQTRSRRSIYARQMLTMFRVLVATGCRPGELCRATWGATSRCPQAGWNPQWQPTPRGWAGLITVYGKTTRKTGRLRRIVILPPLVRAIERIRLSEHKHETHIFARLGRGRDGHSSTWDVQAFGSAIRKLRIAAKIGDHFTLYSLRHRSYTLAVGRGGLTADQAGQLGGTSGAVVSRTYLHSDDAALLANTLKKRDSERRK